MPTPYTRNQQATISNPNGTGISWIRQQSGTKGGRDSPQPYDLTEARVLSWPTYNGWPAVWLHTAGKVDGRDDNMVPGSSTWQAARNRAYAELVEAVNGEESNLGTFAAEWRESFGMLGKRFFGLYKAYSLLRKGKFRKALNALGVSPKRKHRNKYESAVHEASGLWLEYWFGWSPMLNDIHGAMVQLTQPLPQGVRQRGRGRDSQYRHQVNTYFFTGTKWYDCRVQTGARFSLSNPNLYLLSQLGIINPATVLWEIIPFSFLVDWVFNVSSFIASFSDFAGLDYQDTYTTETVRRTTRDTWKPETPGLLHEELVWMIRRTNLLRPLPNTQILANLGVSKTRAASAAALFGGILTS